MRKTHLHYRERGAPMPKVSVVIPNYNHARFLRKRIDSVLQQTFQDFELILLDDCSTDDSRSILSSYAADPRVRIEFNDANSGSTFRQWNKGVRLARGEYVWIAESDDYADEKFLARLVAVLDADPKIAYAYCKSWRVSAGGDLDGFADNYLADLDPHRWTADYCADGREECRNYFIRTNSVPNASSVVFRKATFEQVGGADETLRLCGDWKLWGAMALTGKVAYLAEPLNFFRFHDSTVRKKSEHMSADVVEYLTVFHWVLDRVTPPKAVLNNLRDVASAMWVPVIMSTHVSVPRKRAILREVRAIDPHPIRSAIRPALATIRIKLLRHWHALAPKATSETL